MDELNTAPSAVADERTAALSELIASTADEYETPSARITGDKDRENPVEGAPLAGLADELERLLAKATPGPWKATGLPYDGYTAPEITGSNGQYVAQTVYDMQSYTERDEVEADTELIVWLRNHADQLLTALRAERGDGWRTMDSAPRDGTFVQLFEPIAHPPVSVGCYDDEAGWLIGEADFMPSKCRPRYWAPLLPRPDIAPATKSESAVVSDMEAQLAEAQQIARAALEAKP